jgi:hypothetical protein
MKLTLCFRLVLTFIAIICIAGIGLGQSTAPYSEGSVWEIHMVKAKYGLEDDYFKNLTNTLKKALDEAKKHSVILDYKVFYGEAATPQDYNVMLLLEFKNMAMLDNLRDKFDQIFAKTAGAAEPKTHIQVKLLYIREVMGEKVMREIKLK